MTTFEDNNIMSFGKYKGQPLGDIPDSYIIWMWENTDLKESIKEDTEKGSIARYFKLAYDSITK
jgi:uncharacterized protein (DUF3820 family)